MKTFYIILTLSLLFNLKTVCQEAILIVRLDIQPENAIVFIDQQKTDVNKGMVELMGGKHQIRILKNGFDEINDEIKVSRKKTYFKYTLVENPNRIYPEDDFVETGRPAILKIETYTDAVVLVNDSVIPANKFVELEPQKAIVSVYGENTDTSQQEIELISDQTLQLSLFPEPIVIASDIKIELVLVKAGSFLMGKPGNKSNARIHKVELDEFYISKYEITQDLWKMIMKDNPSKQVGDSLPVENVSWEDVRKFIDRLNEITKKNYRLPTEAEWEYAARGGHKAREKYKYSGASVIDSVAWYWKNSGDEILEGRWDNVLIKQNNCRIGKIGQLQPNELGIYDMTGNVWEWCSDWYGEEYYLESPLSNPKGPETGKTKVCRGGSYLSKASYCRNGFRLSYPPLNKYNYLGFRLVLER